MTDAIRIPPNRRTPWSVIAGVLFVLAIGVLSAWYEEHLYQSQRLAAARGQAEVLAASLTAALAFDDRAAADEYVRGMQVNPAIDAVGVYAQSGKRIADFSRGSVSSLPDRITKNNFAHSPPRSILVPVVQGRAPLGWVYLQTAPEPLKNRVSRYLVLALLAVMGAVVIAGMGSAQLRIRTQSEVLAQTNRRLQQEMTERATAEEALRQSQKMEALGQLSGGIAHDLNNHLMIIGGNLSFLRKKLNLGAEERYLTYAEEGLRRAAQLTQRVLGFSRKQSLSPMAVDMGELVSSMEPLIRNSLGEKAQLHLNLHARCKVLVDRNQMENVLLNLALNARDAMPEGGSLTITVADAVIEPGGQTANDLAPGKFVRLSVADTGFGMSEDVRKRALDPFFTTKPVGTGTGLGLSTAFGFICQSAGTMVLESAPNQGTTVIIWLPAAGASSHNEMEI